MRTHRQKTSLPSTRSLIAPGVLLALLAGAAHAGVLLDYGQDAAALNDAGIVRGAGNPNSTFGFDQFQLFNIDAADEAWSIASVTLSLRLFHNFSEGAASLAIYNADALVPDFANPVSAEFDLTAASDTAQQVTINLGGLVLESGSYFVGVRAADPTTDVLWVAGDLSAFRTSRRSDGGYFTGSPRALSLSIDGAVVPAPAGLAMAAGFAGFAVVRRRRA